MGQLINGDLMFYSPKKDLKVYSEEYLSEVVVAIYLRLSDEDKRYGYDESLSITNQKEKLIKYCHDRGWKIYKIYIDDGITGTTFDRDDFQNLIADLEKGCFNTVITKDQSRLGREHVLTDYFMEIYFPQHDIRYIAVDDNYDSENPIGNEIAPYRNLNNEYHARETSKKVRSNVQQRADRGEYVGCEAFGYVRKKPKCNELIIDPVAYKVVRKIVELRKQGYGYNKTAKYFRNEKYLKPSSYKKYNILLELKGEDRIIKADEMALLLPEGTITENDYDWHHETIRQILLNPVYTGDVVNNRSHTKSFKDKKKIMHSEEQWKIAPNKHEAIMERYEHDDIMKGLEVRTRDKSDGTKHIFSGLLRCDECKKALSFSPDKRNLSWSAFQCVTNKKRGSKICSSHRIPFSRLYGVVLEELKEFVKQAKENEDLIIQKLNTVMNPKYKKIIQDCEKEIKKSNSRITAINIIVKQLYEDRVEEKIDTEQFNALSASYKIEQENLHRKIIEINDQVREIENKKDAQKAFVNLLKKYTVVDTLTYELLHDLISKIEVGKNNGRYAHQEVAIHYKAIGFVGEIQEIIHTEVKSDSQCAG